MKKLLFSIGITLSLLTSATAQDVQITSGAAYKKATFYSLTTDAKTLMSNTDWDIAFTVYGQQDAGIFLNEAAGSGEAALKLYKAPTNDFTKTIVAAELKDSLYNDEASWAYGAFNAERNPTNPFDYGWATYSTTTKEVVGNKVFVIKLRNGNFRKIEIQKLNQTVYTFRHANLDGSDEKTATVDKAKFAGRTLAYFSFATDTAKDLEPAAGFDLLLTRYHTIAIQAGQIPTLYPVLGVLTGRGVQVAKAEKVNTKTVNVNDYATKFEKKTDVIGWDWKVVNINTNAWTVLDDRAYFVKLKDGKTIYKITFVDFEGSATGTTTFEKSEVKLVVSTSNQFSKDINLNVFPTVATNEINIAFDNKTEETFSVFVSDMMGRTLSQSTLNVSSGFNVNALNISDLATGNYVLTLKSNKGFATAKFVKN